jgi:hypothetical protein
LVLLTAALLLAKVNLAVLLLLPFLLLRPSRFKFRGGYLALALAVLVLLAVEVLGWNLVALNESEASFGNPEPIDQLQYLVRNPLDYVTGLIRDLGQRGLDYMQGWIAAYGYYYWSVPPLTYWFFVAALVLAYLKDRSDGGLDRRTQIALLTVAVGSYLATAIVFQLIAVPAGSSEIYELQGRYFTALAPVMVLALLGIGGRLPRLRQEWILPATAAVGLAAFTGGLYLSYHLTCGTTFYRPGLCYLPQYKNWAPEERFSPPFSQDLELRQELQAECANLAQVRVWTDSSEASPAGSVEIALRDIADGSTVAQEVIPNLGLPDQGWITLDFASQDDSLDQRYLITLRSADSGNVIGPRISYTLRPEYELGLLYENERPVDHDLFFQYGCISGLQSMIEAVGG